MSAGQSQNLPGPLQQAEAAYRDGAARLPVTGALIARHVRHFAADARLSRSQPEAMRRLHEVTGGCRDVPSLRILLPKILDGAMMLTGADYGTIQLLDPVTGSLRIVTQVGFDSGFLEYFAVVDQDHSACGRAAWHGVQTVISDVSTEPGFAPHCGVAAASGFRAVQSIPLADQAGRLIGIVSTYFRRPHRRADLDLQITELFADVAGDAIAEHLDTLDDDRLGDRIGRAAIPPPLGPGGDPEPGAAAVPGPDADPDTRERGPAPEAASPQEAVSQFAGYVVNRLFSVGLSLDSARSIVGEGPAGDRVAAATGEVDQMIRDIRTIIFGRTEDRQDQSSVQEHPAASADHAAVLNARMVRTARALQTAAADYAALLEQRAALTRQPGPMDYPTEIKRWRAFADRAEHMANRRQQPP